MLLYVCLNVCRVAKYLFFTHGDPHTQYLSTSIYFCSQKTQSVWLPLSPPPLLHLLHSICIKAEVKKYRFFCFTFSVLWVCEVPFPVEYYVCYPVSFLCKWTCVETQTGEKHNCPFFNHKSLKNEWEWEIYLSDCACWSLLEMNAIWYIIFHSLVVLHCLQSKRNVIGYFSGMVLMQKIWHEWVL